MNSDQLGSVEVRAHTQGAEIGAAITVERRDAHTALGLELPALQQSLADKHLPVPRVVLTQGSLGTNTGAHSQAQQNPGQSRHQDPRNSAFHQYFSAGSTTTLPGHLNPLHRAGPTFQFARQVKRARLTGVQIRKKKNERESAVRKEKQKMISPSAITHQATPYDTSNTTNTSGTKQLHHSNRQQ